MNIGEGYKILMGATLFKFAWTPDEGQADPFIIFYDLIFQTTIGLVACRELGNDIDAISRLQADFGTLGESSTAQTLLLSWLPSKRKQNKKAATSRLHTTLSRYINARKESNIPSPDTIDFLLHQGQTTNEIVGFILGTLFAGTSSAPVIVSWVFIFLAFHKDWKLKVLTELRTLLESHPSDCLASDPLQDRLKSVPIDVWENETPVMDIVLRETIRKQTVPRGGFVVYPIWDTHLNPDIYHCPNKFDPERFAADRMEDKKQTFAFLGWGAGRHPCPGMHVAKLEMKIFVASSLLAFDYGYVSDASGEPLTQTPKPNYNDIRLLRAASSDLSA
ncbi:hypothetical protein H0H92_010092 [Tricholoma furcatifolium]|nr:hypothetical protein H0H92_010092 [Tricholoma furcatifolium]